MKKQIICNKIDFWHVLSPQMVYRLIAENIVYQSDISNEKAGSVLQEEVTLTIAPEKVPEILNQNLRYFLLTLYTAENQVFTVGTKTYPTARLISTSVKGSQIKFTAKKPI